MKYGVLPAHYDVVGQALLATLEGGLGAEWNEQARWALAGPHAPPPLCGHPQLYPTTTATAGEGLVDGSVRHHRQDHDRGQLPGEGIDITTKSEKLY